MTYRGEAQFEVWFYPARGSRSLDPTPCSIYLFDIRASSRDKHKVDHTYNIFHSTPFPFRLMLRDGR